jgi:uncharacterized protein (TIGR00251 family)
MASRRPDNQPIREDATPPTGTPWLQVRGADLVLRVHVQPRASQEGIEGVHGDRLRLRVSAPPVEGAANARVIAVLAELLGIPRGALTVMRGAKSRDKDLVIHGAAARARQLAARLS